MNRVNHQHALITTTIISFLRHEPDNQVDLEPGLPKIRTETVRKSLNMNPEFALGVSQIQNPNSCAVSHPSLASSSLLLHI